MEQTVAVIGGGASGMMAAITAARNGARVTVFEPKERLGKKLLATGNGKCNFTNLCQAPDCYRGTHPEFAGTALQLFSVDRTLAFFEEIGILAKLKNGYAYPNSEQAVSVADALSMELRACGVHLQREAVQEIACRKNGGFLVVTEQEKTEFSRVILACGSRAGLPEQAEFHGYDLVYSLGHHTTRLLPALVQLRSKEKWLKTVAGVRTEAEVTLLSGACPVKRETGELLFTEYGLSGIPVLQLSRFAGELLAEQKEVVCLIDFFPTRTVNDLQKLLSDRRNNCRKRTAEELLVGLLNHKLNYILLKECGLEPTAPAETVWGKVQAIQQMAARMKGLSCRITGTNSFSQAQVTAGGIRTEELHEDTMESRLHRGLYFAGEMIDIDGTCGGYNLQWAWSSGYVAGLHAATDDTTENNR